MQLFWHVAVMGNWRTVVSEQANLFKTVGLRPIICRVGPPADGMLPRIGDVLYTSSELREYETPTLYALWKWCRANPGETVMYCHTKGVSKQTPLRTAWRHAMQKFLVEPWQENEQYLADYDAVGFNWLVPKDWPIPHFSGNFWMATTDWINTLVSPYDYQKMGDSHWQESTQHPWWPWIHAEMWLGSNRAIRSQSVGCEQHPVINDLPFLQKLLGVKA